MMADRKQVLIVLLALITVLTVIYMNCSQCQFYSTEYVENGCWQLCNLLG